MGTKDYTLHTDKYEINMMYAHWYHGTHNQKTVFEVYFRTLPFGNGFAVFAGLERIIRYLQNLVFTESALQFLIEQEEQYDLQFIEQLRSFRFSGNVYAVEEGTVVFPNEPLIRVEARVFEAQLIETALLNFMNYQTLIATKAARIRQVAPNDILMEFGSRRAQEADAALWGTRAAYLGGFDATSNMLASKMFGIPAKGTHAHSWVQCHASEEEAFHRYAEALPNQVTLLVDTYDILKTGVPNAIKIGQHMKSMGKSMNAIRLDSGDLAYMSIQSRKMLDDAGLHDVKIVASNDLDENTILNLKAQGARIDSWGVGTRLITAFDDPALGGVYKLVAREVNGTYEPAIKISGNLDKMTNPGIKKIYRLINKETGKAIADYITLIDDEDVDHKQPLKLFHPKHPYIHRVAENYEAVPLLKPIFAAGELVYTIPTLSASKKYHEEQLTLFWPEYLRKLNPEYYPVNLSEKAYNLKMELIQKMRT